MVFITSLDIFIFCHHWQTYTCITKHFHDQCSQARVTFFKQINVNIADVLTFHCHENKVKGKPLSSAFPLHPEGNTKIL